MNVEQCLGRAESEKDSTFFTGGVAIWPHLPRCAPFAVITTASRRAPWICGQLAARMLADARGAARSERRDPDIRDRLGSRCGAKQRRRRWRDFRRRDAAEGRITEATGRLPHFPVCFSMGACLPRSAKRVPRGSPAPECLARCGALRTQRSRYFCAQCFSFARGMEAHHWGPPLAVVMRLLCRPPAFTRAPKGGSGGTPGLVLKALLRARPARRSKTDAPHPLGGGGARGNAWGQVSGANTLEGWRRART
jgi:hypothetical protein